MRFRLVDKVGGSIVATAHLYADENNEFGYGIVDIDQKDVFFYSDGNVARTRALQAKRNSS